VRLINDSFNQLVKLVEQVGTRLPDGNSKTIGIFPGAFKPPHRGHYATAAAACDACDEVYIFMSPKARRICQPSKDTGVPEWHKFKGLLNKNRPGIRVELAEVDRQTSASKFRQRILDTSLDKCDIETFTNNIDEYLPEMEPVRKQRAVQELMSKSVKDGQITAAEASNIWRLYTSQLEVDYQMAGRVHFETVQVSPIISSYHLVDGDPEKGTDGLVQVGWEGTVRLYTGT
jgi:hypothetical protein